MTSSMITAVNDNEPMDPPHPEPTGRGAVARSPRRTRSPICMPMSRRANTVKAALFAAGGPVFVVDQRMAQATRRRGAGGQTARREGWQAHRRTGRDRAAHPRTRSRKQAVAHHRGRLDIMGKAHALLESLSERADSDASARSADRDLRNADRTWCIDKAGSHIDRAGPLTATRRRDAATALTPQSAPSLRLSRPTNSPMPNGAASLRCSPATGSSISAVADYAQLLDEASTCVRCPRCTGC